MELSVGVTGGQQMASLGYVGSRSRAEVTWMRLAEAGSGLVTTGSVDEPPTP